jgi:two-component system chemotaxis response regulator CheB
LEAWRAFVIRLLLAEDSAVQRELLRFVLEESGEFEIVGCVADGAAAIEQTAVLKPDIILMDCHMPKVDGIEATRIIMEKTPTPIVIASATSSPSDAELPFDAIANGALAFVSKPAAIGTPAFDRDSASLVRTLRLMSEVKVVGRRTRGAERKAAAVPTAERERCVDVIGLVGSTGAPGVFDEILSGVRDGLSPPLLIVQHMSAGFVGGFAAWLAARTGVNVTLANHGQLVRAGCAYVAPDGHHLGITPFGQIQLSEEAEDDGFRPSGSRLLRSLARSYGARAMGVVLTGMGRDGAAGLLELQRAGATTVVQNEGTCVVFGMPHEAIRLGAAQHVLAPAEIAALIRSCGAAPQRT